MIFIDDLAHADRIARASGTVFNPRADHSISRTDDTGVLLGGVIYSGFTGESIGMHTAGFHPQWVNRDMLWVCFDYPFNQLGVNKIFGQVPAGNARALEFDKKLGFKEEAVVRGVFPGGEDLVVLSMDRVDCRWLGLTPAVRKLMEHV